VIPERLFARAGEVWDATVQSIDRNKLLVERGVTACHGDLHPGNWYRCKDGSMGLNDWQCITRGAWQRDLAYILAAGPSVANRRAWEKDLVKQYLRDLKTQGGPSPSEEDTWREIRGQLPTVLSL
jgi:thiamine kinase-like enzyme